MKKILSVLVITAMLVCVFAVSALAAGFTVTFVDGNGAELAKAQVEGDELVFAIACSPPTDIVSFTASAGELAIEQQTLGGPSTPQGTTSGVWALKGIAGDVTVTLVLNTMEGADLPIFTFGRAEAEAAYAAAGAGMGAPPEGGAPGEMAPPPADGAAPGAPTEGAPAPEAAPAPAPEVYSVSFVSDTGIDFGKAEVVDGEVVFGVKCSPPTDIISFDITGGELVCQQSTAGGPSTPQGTINGIWTLKGIEADVTVTLNLNTQEGAAAPEFFIGAEEAAAGVGSGGMGGGAPMGAAPAPAAPEAPADLVGPATGSTDTAVIVLAICLFGMAALVPVAVKKFSK